MISANCATLSLNVCASACAASLRFLPSRSCKKFSVGSMASVLPDTLKRRLAMVASNWRFHAVYAVIDFS